MRKEKTLRLTYSATLNCMSMHGLFLESQDLVFTILRALPLITELFKDYKGSAQQFGSLLLYCCQTRDLVYNLSISCYNENRVVCTLVVVRTKAIRNHTYWCVNSLNIIVSFGYLYNNGLFCSSVSITI